MIEGLEDIAPTPEVVPIGKGSVTVRGLSLEAVPGLVARFQPLASLFQGKTISAQTLIDIAPGAAAAIMSAGCGYSGNTEAEGVFSSLPIETQFDLLERIIRLTFPGGAGPFLERVSRIASSVNVDALAASVMTGSPQLSQG